MDRLASLPRSQSRLTDWQSTKLVFSLKGPTQVTRPLTNVRLLKRKCDFKSIHVDYVCAEPCLTCVDNMEFFFFNMELPVAITAYPQNHKLCNVHQQSKAAASPMHANKLKANKTHK